MKTATKTRLVTLRNNFHATNLDVRVPANAVQDAEEMQRGSKLVRLSYGQYRRAHRALCGISDCTCGGVYRNHHAQQITADEKGEYEVLVCSDDVS